MDQLPPAVLHALEGRIDPYSQHVLEKYAQAYLIFLTVASFFVSFFASSVILALEVFQGGLVLLLLLAVPPWPLLKQHPIRFLPVRKAPLDSNPAKT